MAFGLSTELLASIKALGHKYAIEKIVLFGSRATGDNKPISDIDLAVYPSPGFNEQGEVASEIDDLWTLLKIDVVFISDRTDRSLVMSIEKEGVPLYERT